MDANKADVLREIDYQINPTCGTCHFGDFKPKTDWGTCRCWEYKHEKHSGEPRKLSIYRSGSCHRFDMSEDVKLSLHGFEEFVKEGTK